MAVLARDGLAFELVNSYEDDLLPTKTVTANDSGVTVDYIFHGAVQIEDDLYSGTFNLSIPGFGVNMFSGEPAWLVHWDTFEIPSGCNVSVNLLIDNSIEIPICLAPAREAFLDSEDSNYSRENVLPIKEFNGWLPSSPLEQGDIKVYRDRNILYVGVYPISYNYNEQKIKASEHLSYSVEFSKPLISVHSDGENEVIHNLNRDFMNSTFAYVANDDSHKQRVSSFPSPVSVWSEGDSYLILSNQKYSAAVNKFANWKRKLGHNVKIVNSNSWTPTSIKNKIKAEYSTNKYLNYLILFGDEIDLPGEYYNVCGLGGYTDYYYACLDGDNDEIPDLLMGRISVTNLKEADSVVDKIINYESMTSKSAQPDGIAVHCAEFSDSDPNDGFEDRRYTRTSEDIANGITEVGKTVKRVYYYNRKNETKTSSPTNWSKGALYGKGEIIPAFLRNTSFNWKGNATDIINAINSGASYVFHRDHGLIQEWSQPKFKNTDVKKLSNGDDTPIVFSINCLTGMYEYYPTAGVPQPDDLDSSNRSTCLAEAFLRKEGGGAVGVVAASQLTYTVFNEAFAMEMFQSRWPDSQFSYEYPYYIPTDASSSRSPVYRMGEIMNAGKLRLEQNYTRSSSSIKHNNLAYHYFGDPGMRFLNNYPVYPHFKCSKNLDTSIKVESDIVGLFVRVNKSTGDTSTIFGKGFTVALSDISQYNYFFTGNNTPPVEVDPYLQLFVLNETNATIETVLQTGNTLTVKYCLTDDLREGTTVSVRYVESVSNYIYAEDCTDGLNEVNFNLDGKERGVYVIELKNNDIVLDTQKVMIK